MALIKDKRMDVELSPRLVALRSGDAMRQLEVLYELRDGEDATLLPELLKMVTQAETDSQVRREVVELLSDVRSRALVAAMGEALRAGGEGPHLPLLVSICWMNSMDFSPILDELLELVSHSDLQVQVEAVTSVELALERSSLKKLREGIAVLKKRLQRVEGREAKALVKEMINTLEQHAMQRSGREEESR